MSVRRALVVHTRMPAADRDSGSQDVDNLIQFLLRAGWHVTFLAQEERIVTEGRHAERLRKLGVATHNGFAGAERLLRSNDFDLAVVAFWELASQLLPLLRSHAPNTHVVISSMDVHFLRDARRALGRSTELDARFAEMATKELNTYAAADAVLAVSDKERDLLADFLGPSRVFTLPLAEHVERSSVALDERRGMYFVGNFRHLPNREAVEHLCNDVLPLLDPALLERHPLTVLGNWLDRVALDIAQPAAGVELVGWVPSVQPYADRARLAVVPLLHGAGVKRKVIQPMMGGTPVVTTPLGAEGLDLVQGEHALIGADAADLAAGITRLLTDDALWHRLADAGAGHMARRHRIDLVERHLAEILEIVMEQPPRSGEGRRGDVPAPPTLAERTAVQRRLHSIGRPGSVLLVAMRSEADVIDLGTRRCWPFPQSRDGGWAGYEPVDGAAAVSHLEAQRTRGAAYFVLPRSAFSWRHRYPELFEHLETTCLRLHEDEHLAAWDIARDPAEGVRLDPTPPARVQVVGTYDGSRTGPPLDLLRELASSAQLVVEQTWRSDADVGPPPEPPDVDYVVHVRDDAILPGRFLDRLIATMATLGVDRAQPTHADGPTAGPPITERQAGTVAREIDEPCSLPVLAVRTGAGHDGPVVLADNVRIGLRRPLVRASSGAGFVRRTWVAGPDGRPVEHRRPEPPTPPRISVLISTYERPALLRACLASFAKQTLDRADFEVVVVDDGSRDEELDSILAEVTDDLQVVGLRIGHAGRSAAKNHAVLLARAPIVLFFDDDDRAAPDYLERHLDGHAAHPGEAVAILGHTDWAPELEPTSLMHYVTDVDRLMFAYERLADGQTLDWRGFWEGRISCKRSLLLDHGLHDQRLDYSIDVEMAWRLAPSGLRVVYWSSARSLMARPLDFEGFCARTVAKGRAHAVIAALHPGTDLASRLRLDGANALWTAEGHTEQALCRRVKELEARGVTDASALPELHAAYRSALLLLHAKGAAGADDVSETPAGAAATVAPLLDGSGPELLYDETPADHRGDPMISISIPVWSRTPELAEMATRTIERIWEVAKIPTEVVVVDNGSPHEVPLPARVYRYDENRGVSVGWNSGIRLTTAPMVVVLNSDCHVEPGWDTALFEAATDRRRIAFPYTDHCDGQGFRQPDQGGTAGWCFMLSRELYDELGPFDEWFSPAFCEDTDYWHRAWEQGIELSPVPAAQVLHPRRTSSGDDDHEMLLQAHRFKYGWKHGVDPHRAPPYYNRDVVDYVGTFRVPDPSHRPDRPRVFGIGLNKTGTSSLHEAFRTLGLESLHWGGPAIRQLVEASRTAGDPLLSRLDQRFDAFSDIQVLSTGFALLDEQYPGSRFILTVRPVDEWVESRRRHVLANQQRQAAGEYAGRFLEIDEEAWRAEWNHHLDTVRSYFSGRDDFLEIDLGVEPGWGPLCRLLDVAEPSASFPWVNRRASVDRMERS